MDEIKRENILIKEYLDKYISPDKQKQMVETFSTSEIRYYLSSIDVSFFAKMYFPETFSEEFGEVHHRLFNIIDKVLKSEGLIQLVAEPRSVGKSTIMTFLLPLYMALFRKVRFILIISSNEASATPFLQMIKDAVQSNELLQTDFECSEGNIWNSEQAVINCRKWKWNACIMIRGITSSMRGIHYLSARPDLIILDDVQKEAKSDTDIERVVDAFGSVVLPLGSKASNIVCVGTVMSQDDLISQMLDGRIAGVSCVREQAIEKFSDSRLWEKWRKIYTDISNENHIEDGDAFFKQHKTEMLKGTKVLWDARPYYWLMKKKLSMRDDLFWCEYQNEPRNSNNYIFKNIQFWDRLPDSEQLRMIMYVDPAIQIKKQSDNSAVCILAESKKEHRFFVVDGSLLKLLPDDLFKYILQQLGIYQQIETVYFEGNAAQSYMADRLSDYLWKNKEYTPVKTIYNSKKKEDRILALEPFVKNGILLFNNNNIRFNEQVMNYCSTVPHDDAIDSVAGAMAQMQAPQAIQYFDITF